MPRHFDDVQNIGHFESVELNFQLSWSIYEVFDLRFSQELY